MKKQNPFDELIKMYFKYGYYITLTIIATFDGLFKWYTDLLNVPESSYEWYLSLNNKDTDDFNYMRLLFAREMWEDENR